MEALGHTATLRALKSSRTTQKQAGKADMVETGALLALLEAQAFGRTTILWANQTAGTDHRAGQVVPLAML
jgi:hypothetical protein